MTLCNNLLLIRLTAFICLFLCGDFQYMGINIALDNQRTIEYSRDDPINMNNNSSPAPIIDLKSKEAPLGDVYADTQVGDCFEFGRYPQGANGEIKPITWRVLQRGEDSLLAIAERGLDCKPYHEESCDISWADCSLRRWLNGEFYTAAFNERERCLILPVTNSNDAGPATEDRVFLLSRAEASSLFTKRIERRAVPTEFALQQGVWTVNSESCAWSGCCEWWLRSRGDESFQAASVRTDGDVYDICANVNCDNNAVRPVLKLNLRCAEKVRGAKPTE